MNNKIKTIITYVAGLILLLFLASFMLTMNKEEEEMLAKYAGGAAASADPKAAKGQGYHVQDLVDAIREDRPVYLGPKDAVTALKIVLAVYKSAKEGIHVKNDHLEA